jgi:hypothetical protein
MKRFSLVLIVGLAARLTAAAADLGPLLEKMAGAYGGRERLEKIVAIRETGQVEAATPIGNSGPIVRTFARPLQLRIEIGDSSKPTEVRVLNGTNGWRNGKPATGPGLDAMVLQAIRLDLPFQLLANQSKLIEKDSIERGGKRLRVLELPLEHGLSVTAALDAESGRILISTGTTAEGPMGRLSFETSYDDFAMVDGALFAFKEVNLANGTKTAKTAMSIIQILKTSPAEAFKPQSPEASCK